MRLYISILLFILYLMGDQEVCLSVCNLYVCVRPQLQRGSLYVFNYTESIFDQGLRFSSPYEGGSLTLVRKCKIRGQIRVK